MKNLPPLKFKDGKFKIMAIGDVHAPFDISDETNRLRSADTLKLLNKAVKELEPDFAVFMGDMGKDAQTLVLNANNRLVQRLMEEKNAEEPTELGKKITEQLYDMALLQRGGLDQERMAAFIARSQELMLQLA